MSTNTNSKNLRRTKSQIQTQLNQNLPQKNSKPTTPTIINPQKRQFKLKRWNTYQKQNTIHIEHFKLIRVLGKGRFGLVHLAIHHETGFLCAIKIIAKKHLQTKNQQETFKLHNQTLREIKNQSFMKHPNIIQLYSIFHDDQKIYMIMEPCVDGQLFNFICGKSKLQQETVSFILKQILTGLTYMHQNSIIHRDIKPENIIFNYVNFSFIQCTPKICDFGWSVFCSQDVRSTICGTPLYFPPEIITGKSHNEKIDTWAIGTLTYELLTSQNPFKISKSSQISKIVTQNFTMQKGSKSCKDFIKLCLQKDVNKRISIKQLLIHPFIQKYSGMNISQQLCKILNKKLYEQ